MRWSESVTLIFVKLYCKHEHLWDLDNPLNRNRFQRQKSYKSICEEFEAATGTQITVSDVKTKIKNLRSTYAQVVNKMKELSSADPPYVPSLIWFNEMDKCLRRVSNLKITEHNQVKGANFIEPIADSDNEYFNSDPLVTPEPSPNKNNKRKVKISKMKRRKTEEKYFDNTDSSSDDGQKDEFDVYGKHIATQLRSMNLPTALRLQMEIQNLISGARLSDML